MKAEFLTIVEMCRRLGISLDGAYRLVYAGRVEATKVDGKWAVSKKSVEERLRRKRNARA